MVYDTSSVGWSEYADFAETKYNRHGELPWDDQHYLKFNGSYHLPLGFIVGGSLNWRSGRPYNQILQVVPPGRSGQFPAATMRQYYLEQRGSHRLGSAWWIDLRLRKDFEIGPTVLSLTADAFNLTNNQQVTGRYEIDGDHWGDGRQLDEGRVFRAGGEADVLTGSTSL